MTEEKAKTFSVLTGMLCTAAFVTSLFFQGGYDIQFAPALILLLIMACVAVIPSFWPSVRSGAESLFRAPKGVMAALLFLLWAFLMAGLFWSNVPYVSLVTFLVVTALPLVFFSFTLSPRPEIYITPALYLVMIIMAGLAVYALIQTVTDMGDYQGRAHLPLANPNSLAGLLNFGFLLALAWVFKDKSARYLPALLALLIFSGVLATGSRGGIIAGVLAAIVLACLLRGAVRSRLGWGLLPVLFVLTGLYALFIDESGRLLSLLSGSGLQERLVIWGTALEMAHQNLLTGIGLGTFYLYYPAYRLPLLDQSLGHWAHMDSLQLFVETGLAGPMLFYALALAVAFAAGRALRLAAGDDKIYIAGAAAGLLAFFLHSHLTFHFYVMPILIAAGLWLAVLYVYVSHCLKGWGGGYTEIPIDNWQKPFMAVVVLAIATAFAAMAGSAASGHYFVKQAQAQMAKRNVEGFMETVELAEKWAPRSFAEPKVQMTGLYIEVLRGVAPMFEQETRRSMLEQGLQALDIAEQLNPPWAEVNLKRARLYMAAGDDLVQSRKDKALLELQEAVEKNPMHFAARLDLARLMVEKGRPDRAYDLLRVGLQYPHDKDTARIYSELLKQLEPVVHIQRQYLKGDDES